MNLSLLSAAITSQPTRNGIITTVHELERQDYSIIVDGIYQGTPALVKVPKKLQRLLCKRPIPLELSRRGIHEKWNLFFFDSDTHLLGGLSSNFIYRAVGGDTSAINIQSANAGSTGTKIAGRIAYLRSKGFRLEFVGIEGANLLRNLQLIDTALPEILSHLLEYKYSGDTDSSLLSLVDYLRVRNPLKFDLSAGHPFYEYKLERFLVDVALGMIPSERWTGEFDATGGIIIVKQDGDVVCYHIYNYNEFETYLLHNTRLEQASTSRYKFGDIYREGGELRLKLNLQVRFT